MDPRSKNPIIFRSLCPDSPFWNVSFSGAVDEFAGYELDEVGAVIDRVLGATRDGLFAAGFISYEASPAFDPAMPVKESHGFPKIWFRTFETMVPGAAPHNGEGSFFISKFHPEVPAGQYMKKVSRIREYLRQGEAYQVNFTYRLLARFAGCEMSLFNRLLCAESPPYAAYIDCGRYQILSFSPELFFHRVGASIRTRPMKGTMPRDEDEQRDRKNFDALKNSPKEISENLMIVDLLRNDLGRISMAGSVAAPSLFTVEKYRTVYQMTSEIRSTLREDICLNGVLGSLFPCGSVTGAPKIRSMEIIKELETSPRNIYTGSIGYLTPGGEAAFNVAIRTAVIDREKKTLRYGTGGGIVYDSTPEDEYEESRTKSIFIRSVGPAFKLIETILYERKGGFFLLSEHLARLERSAEYFGFPCDRSEILEKMDRAVKREGLPRLKVRVLLGPDGETEVKGTGLPPSDRVTTRRLKVYREPVDKDDEFRYHKTTVRGLFERALRDHPEVDDLIFLNGEGEVTETSIANIVALKDGRYLTPPVSSGLLPGTFREKLLREGVIEERVLTPGDLARADRIYLVNSVKKWECAEIVGETGNHNLPLTGISFQNNFMGKIPSSTGEEGSRERGKDTHAKGRGDTGRVIQAHSKASFRDGRHRFPGKKTG
ncbi:MAG: aminodeoxychorismate synthase component I [Deltaproteobacteria bacterium]|nr:aminodeoxychorismate synthase component I [Deltaproteobacteria bacterium]NIS77630.1 aminodeoxychorismate synthase component I [Deltaproteobacteria bacterium]